MEDLKTHIEAAQKKVKYFCAQCQYKATTLGSLKKQGSLKKTY